MTNKLSKLLDQYYSIKKKIKKELDKLEEMECNCDNCEEINLVTHRNHELGVDRICGNCGGVIWDRELY